MMPATIEAREESTHVATVQPAVKLTYENYRAAPADKRYELLDGELIMVPVPNLKHQTVQLKLTMRLGLFIENRALGTLFTPVCDVMLSETDVVQPDLLFVSREREHLLSGGQNVQGAPDLVVEILSPSTAERDRSDKRVLYGRHGVMEYWLVDPMAETVQIHRLEGEVLLPTRTFGREETLRSPLLTRFELHLNEISGPDGERSTSGDTKADHRRGRRTRFGSALTVEQYLVSDYERFEALVGRGAGGERC